MNEEPWFVASVISLAKIRLGWVTDDDGTKVSFWESIIRFIKQIISFFGKLFGASSGSDGSNS